MRFFIALLSSALLAAAADLSNAIPADTTVVARFDLPKVRNSIVVTKIIDKNFERYLSMLESVETTTGIRLDGVQTVWLLAVKENHGAIVLDGTVAPATVRTHADKAAAKHGHVKISSDGDFPLFVSYKDKNVDMSLAVQDGRAIMGNTAYVTDLLAALRGNKEALADNQLLGQLRDSTAPVAVAMLAMNDQLAKRNRDLAAMVQSGFATIDLTDTVIANVALQTANVDQADGLHMIAQGMIALQAAQLQQMQTNPDEFSAQRIRQAMVMNEVLKTARISRKDATVLMNWTMSDAAKNLIGETATTATQGLAVP